MKLHNQFYASLLGVDINDFLHRPASDKDYNQLIRSTCQVNLEGKPPIVYIKDIGDVVEELLPHLQNLRYSASQRFNLGKGNKSILFGAVPSSINKSNHCTFGAVASHDSDLHKLLCTKYAAILQLLMADCLPCWSQVWKKLYELKPIHADYRMEKSIWTSGIINYNSPHNYHYDEMNRAKMISAMLTFKDGIKGGHLCFPEYGLAFEVGNRSAIFFSGKEILHGVTPMNIDKDGHRISIVYYTTDSLVKCGSQEEEIQKALLK